MSHFRTVHDRGIADTLWKRMRWGSQSKRGKTLKAKREKVKTEKPFFTELNIRMAFSEFFMKKKNQVGRTHAKR